MAKKKQRHQLSRFEFIFIFVSLVSMIIIGIHFGYRSLYYYSKETMQMRVEKNTLNGLITSSEVVSDGVGLYKKDNEFYFKGNVDNNYVLFSNRIFRVIRVNSDNTVKLLSNDIVSSFMWGKNKNYDNSNLRNWITKTKLDFSGVYYNTLPSKYLSKTKWTEDTITDGKIQVSKKENSDFVVIPSIYDYTVAGGSESYFNNGKVYQLLGHDKDGDNLYVDEDGSLQKSDALEGYGVRAVITLKANSVVSSGDGTINNPYVIDLGKTKNYVGQYVKLGNDIWKVINDNSGLLKMVAFSAPQIGGVELFNNYSYRESFFDINDKDSIAYYLNTTYFNSLSYNKFLIDNYYYTGQVNDDTEYNYNNIYTNFTVCKVGLLNIFDYNENNNFDEYFYMNTRSDSGAMQYVGRLNGFLEEADVKEVKRIIPVISIDSKNIINGIGTLEDPYVLE